MIYVMQNEEKKVVIDDHYMVLIEGAQAEIVEKKSRFIATVRPDQTEEEAVAFIDEMKKKYYDARHNCSAFIIGPKGAILRSSDDGEPQGTAGKPMLDLLVGSEVRNIAAVVTRYFGGTLLGTGGLVRAYSGALKEALVLCKTAENHYGVELKVGTDYNGVGKIQYIIGKYGIETLHSEYGADVEFTLMVPIEDLDGFQKELIEATNAKVKLEEIERRYYLKEMK